MCRPRHGHSTNNSPHSFRVRIVAPSLWFALLMDLFLGPQCVSTCISLLWLMSRRLLFFDFKIGRAWRRTALGTDILRITHLIPYGLLTSFLSCSNFLFCIIDGSISWCAVCKYLRHHLVVHDINIGRAWRCFASCRYNSPHSFCVRILLPTLILYTLDAVSF